MSSTLPSYFNISPDRAMAETDPPVGTGRFGEIAEAARAGRDDLAGRGLDESGTKALRRFSTWEITKYLIPRRLPILIPKLIISVPVFIFYEATLSFLGVTGF